MLTKCLFIENLLFLLLSNRYFRISPDALSKIECANQFLKCEWTVMDAIQAMIYRPGRRPATYFSPTAWTRHLYAAWMASMGSCWNRMQRLRKLLHYERLFYLLVN